MDTIDEHWQFIFNKSARVSIMEKLCIIDECGCTLHDHICCHKLSIYIYIILILRSEDKWQVFINCARSVTGQLPYLVHICYEHGFKFATEFTNLRWILILFNACTPWEFQLSLWRKCIAVCESAHQDLLKLWGATDSAIRWRKKTGLTLQRGREGS